MIVDFDARVTIMIAILVLFLGKLLNRKVVFFQNYNIPEPVTGGVLASLILTAFASIYSLQFVFDLSVRDDLLVIFFTTIGLSARLSDLIQGGRTLVVMLLLATGYLFLQNVVGVGVFGLFDMPLQTGVLAGSVSLSGGHGTAIAWSERFAANYGIDGAAQLGIACATFGLIFGGIVGGPLAKGLIKKYQLKSDQQGELVVGVAYKDVKTKQLNIDNTLITLFVVLLALGIGNQINVGLLSLGIELPVFVSCLFAGIVLTNTVPYFAFKRVWPANSEEMAFISDICLGLFLAMSLMSIDLMSLSELALPFMMLLAAQVGAVILYARFVVFNCLGRDYDSAVMAAGYSGLALGATPTAIANMTAVTQQYWPSTKAFLVIPLVGAFFIDIANTFVIQLMLRWVS